MKRKSVPVLTIAAASSLLLAAGDAPLASGLWEIRNTPGVATLDGRPLVDLPLGPIKTQTLCLGSAETKDPVRFFARDLGQDCAIATASVAGGRVKIVGSCPNQLEGPDSTFELAGKVSTDRYNVGFATTAIGENGRMTFSGKMTGRRVGACGAAGKPGKAKASPR